MKQIDLKKQNKILITVIAVILSVTVALSCTIFGVFYMDYGVDPDIPDDVRAHNVILLIGDGMGYNHIKTAELYNNGSMSNIRKLSVNGEVITRSLTAGATDSAAAATAMATGKKTYNGRISYLNGKSIPTIAEQAKAAGKKV
ncbi:MAG: alkaline phosphatase, partial [Clostridia bacterium]|nr:alkaline phosphatase [Clostridia bacterium]